MRTQPRPSASQVSRRLPARENLSNLFDVEFAPPGKRRRRGLKQWVESLPNNAAIALVALCFIGPWLILALGLIGLVIWDALPGMR